MNNALGATGVLVVGVLMGFVLNMASQSYGLLEPPFQALDVAKEAARQDYYQEAAEKGFGEFALNKETGEVEFEWLDLPVYKRQEERIRNMAEEYQKLLRKNAEQERQLDWYKRCTVIAPDSEDASPPKPDASDQSAAAPPLINSAPLLLAETRDYAYGGPSCSMLRGSLFSHRRHVALGLGSPLSQRRHVALGLGRSSVFSRSLFGGLDTYSAVRLGARSAALRRQLELQSVTIQPGESCE